MELEHRYDVVKVRDAEECLNPNDRAALDSILRRVAEYRRVEGKTPLKGIFIEDDWPEYSVVLKMLGARVDDPKTGCRNIEFASRLLASMMADCPMGSWVKYPEESTGRHFVDPVVGYKWDVEAKFYLVVSQGETETDVPITQVLEIRKPEKDE